MKEQLRMMVENLKELEYDIQQIKRSRKIIALCEMITKIILTSIGIAVLLRIFLP